MFKSSNSEMLFKWIFFELMFLTAIAEHLFFRLLLSVEPKKQLLLKSLEVYMKNTCRKF